MNIVWIVLGSVVFTVWAVVFVVIGWKGKAGSVIPKIPPPYGDEKRS